MRARLSRRTFLRGAGGLAVGLPLLDAMLDDSGTALAQGLPIPKRYAVAFGGYSLRTDKDGSTDGVVPSRVGPGYDLKAAMLPLGGHGGIQSEVSVVSG